MRERQPVSETDPAQWHLPLDLRPAPQRPALSEAVKLQLAMKQMELVLSEVRDGIAKAPGKKAKMAVRDRDGLIIGQLESLLRILAEGT